MSGKFARTGTGLRRLSLLRSQVPSSWFAGLSL